MSFTFLLFNCFICFQLLLQTGEAVRDADVTGQQNSAG